MIFHMERSYNEGELINGLAPDWINFNLLAVVVILIVFVIGVFATNSALVGFVGFAFTLTIAGFVIFQEGSSISEREYFVLDEPSEVIELMSYQNADEVYFTDKDNSTVKDVLVVNPYDYGAKEYKFSEENLDNKIMKWIVLVSGVVLVISLMIGALIPGKD